MSVVQIFGLCVGAILLREVVVNMLKFICNVILLFIYFPIVAMIDKSTAWEKLKDKLCQ